MEIWLALIIPFIFAIGTFILYRRQVLWWEFFVPFIFSFMLIGLAKLITDSCQTRDTEWWGSIIDVAWHYEAWDEYIHATCSRQVPSGTDANGNTTYTIEYYDCSYVDYHPEYFEAITTSGEVIGISGSYYTYLTGLFNNRSFKDMHRDYHSRDGDAYYTNWDNQKETAQPIVTQHSYENKVAVSSDVFNFPEVDTSDVKLYGLFDYPKLKKDYSIQTILGVKDLKAEKEVAYWNGILGPKKQARLWFLIFKDKPKSAGQKQEMYWKGGNKNELIVCIGVDKDNNIQWNYPFSWTEVVRLKHNVRDYFYEQEGKKLDLIKSIQFVAQEVNTHFIRKQFADFDYLTVDPPLWATILVFILTAALNLIIALWVVNNEYEED